MIIEKKILRSYENRVCANINCVNTFLIKKKNIGRKYCDKCKNNRKVIYNKNSRNKSMKLLFDLNLKAFTPIFTGPVGFRLKSVKYIELGHSRENITKRHIIVELENIIKELTEDLTHLKELEEIEE